MKTGDFVEWDIAENAMSIGIVREVEGAKANVTEVHAFHQIWGSSNAGRGTEHTVKIAKLRPCRTGWRHIISKYENGEIKAKGAK